MELDLIRYHIAPTVRKFAPLFAPLGFTYEDVEQEALIASLDFLASGDYAERFALLRKMLNWRLVDIMRHNDLNIRRKVQTRVIYHGTGNAEERLEMKAWTDSAVDPYCERLDEIRDARETIDYYLSRSGLSARDRDVVKGYSQGLTLKETGALSGISEASACLIVSKFKKACRRIHAQELEECI